VRGGQGNDVVQGGAGNDFVAGDLGLDTLTGGAGADVFYSFGSGGADVITDFDRAEGDVIQLEAGSSWSAAQRGADVVVSIGGGAELLLNNVSLASLTNGWIIA
jgi:Ca2+-binding RTX toxin-like protein